MDNFVNWLVNEREKDINFGMWSKDGTVIVYIDGKRHEYLTDPMFHERWQTMARFAPWKVLNDIKQQSQKMKPKAPIIKDNNSCPGCGTGSPNYQTGIECPGCSEVY